MTTADFIDLTTDGTLTLVKEKAIQNDELSLAADEYFALMVYTDYQSYLRNYREYKGKVNENLRYDSYDIGIDKTSGENGYYVSKYFNKRLNLSRGRTIIVTVNDISKCVLLS